MEHCFGQESLRGFILDPTKHFSSFRKKSETVPRICNPRWVLEGGVDPRGTHIEAQHRKIRVRDRGWDHQLWGNDPDVQMDLRAGGLNTHRTVRQESGF